MIIDCPACDHRHVILDRADGTFIRCECSHQFRLPADKNEDPATKCSNCGANPPADARHCPFCDAHLATVRCGRCMAQSVEGDRHCRACGHEHGVSLPAPTPRADHVLACPRCDHPLRATTAGDATIDDCEHCGGVWLDLNVFALALKPKDGKSAVLEAVRALTPATKPPAEITPQPGKRFYIGCPHCATTMDRRQFAKISRVVVDVCKDHGIWLDHDELPQIVRFVADGGLAAARKKEITQQVDHLLRRDAKTGELRAFPSRRYEFDTHYGNLFLDVVAGVLGMLKR